MSSGRFAVWGFFVATTRTTKENTVNYRFYFLAVTVALLAQSSLSLDANAQSDPSGFDRVVNFPDGSILGLDAGTSLGNSMERTQFYFNDGSIVGRDLTTAGLNDEINIFDNSGSPGSWITITNSNVVNLLGGGFIGFTVNSGGVANVRGGLAGPLGSSRINSGGVINLTGGELQTRVETGGVLNMNGGRLLILEAQSGSEVNISGGRFDSGGPRFLPGSSLVLTGGDFRLNGQDYAESNVSLARQDVFTGTLRDGREFILAPSEFDREGAEEVIDSISLNRIDVADGNPNPYHFISNAHHNNPSTVGAGETVNFLSGSYPFGQLTGVGATVNFEGTAVDGGRFRFSESQINVRAGIAPSLTLFNSEVNISGGQARAITASLGSIVNITGGTLRTSERSLSSGAIKDGGTMNISGGIIDFGDPSAAFKDTGLGIRVELGGVLNISGGNFEGSSGGGSAGARGGIFVEEGGSVNISGGSFDFGRVTSGRLFGGRLLASEGSQLNLIGTEFLLDGELLENLAIEQPFIITNRDLTLSGTLLDGSRFSFDLSAFAFDISDSATLSVTLSAIPEPSSIALMLFACVGLACGRRRVHLPKGMASCVLLLGLFGLTSMVSAATFTGLGDLAGGSFNSRASSISGDGVVVVGTANSATGPEVFRWTNAGGMVGLGALPNTFGISANDVSYDGTTIVGSSDSLPFFEQEAFFALSNVKGLGFLFDGFENSLNGVSADGTIFVGRRNSVLGFEAFSMSTAGSPFPVALGDLPGGDYSSFANGISSDATVIVGYSSSAASGEYSIEAFRWTSSTGMVGLGDLAGGIFNSWATGVSADGAVIVGHGTSTSGTESFRWTSGGGMLGLGDLAGGSFYSYASAASGDGSIVVGQSDSSNGFEAFLWDDSNGMRSLRELLINDYGLDLTGWDLWEATGISDDGSTIVGRGSNPDGNPEGWIVNLSTVLAGDFDSDGDVDGADFLSWQRNDGTAAGLALWENDFGAGGAALASSAASVPEPSTTILVGFALLAFGVRRTRFKQVH